MAGLLVASRFVDVTATVVVKSAIYLWAVKKSSNYNWKQRADCKQRKSGYAFCGKFEFEEEEDEGDYDNTSR